MTSSTHAEYKEIKNCWSEIMPMKKPEQKIKPLKITYESADTSFELIQTEGKLSEMNVMGVAINETITRNKIKYQAEELSKAASTLSGKPILKDHNNSVDSIVGRVTASKFEGDKITYQGVIRDDMMIEKIKKGLITNVSIGAQFENTSEDVDENGEMCRVVKGLEFLELSLVAVPGDAHASISQAITEAYKAIQSINEVIIEPVRLTVEKQAEANIMTEQNDAVFKEVEELRAFKKTAEEKERQTLIESTLAIAEGWTKEDLIGLTNEAIRKIAEKSKKAGKGNGEVCTEADKESKNPVKLANGLTMVRVKDDEGKFFSVDTDRVYKEKFFPYCYGKA